jgi:transitional endoplasmic reticulum ATPase
LAPQNITDIENNFDPNLCETDTDLNDLAKKLLDSKHRQFSLLLYGASGAGKSQYIKYLADLMGLKIISYSFSDLISKWHGESEKQIAEAFKKASEEGGFLVFDEADSLLTDRAGSNVTDYRISEVNELLLHMESYKYPFACTTNLFDKIDKAALRRFIFKIKFKYLSKDKLKYTYEHFFKTPAPEALLNTGGLTPGDFSVVKKKHNPRCRKR